MSIWLWALLSAVYLTGAVVTARVIWREMFSDHDGDVILAGLGMLVSIWFGFWLWVPLAVFYWPIRGLGTLVVRVTDR